MKNLNKLKKKLNTLRENIYEIEDEIAELFKPIVDEYLPKCKTSKDFEDLKNKLRPMPVMPSKILLFERIIMAEKLKNT